MTLTAYHTKYFAHDLTRRATSGMDRLSMALCDAVDLNPHQIEDALFAVKLPLSKGVILADEVGLGKTAQAVALELGEKFNLQTRVLDAKAYRGGAMERSRPLEREVRAHHAAPAAKSSVRTRCPRGHNSTAHAKFSSSTPAAGVGSFP